MLLLTRRIGEAIVIADDIVVTVVDVRPGGYVRLGIAAPIEIPIHRQEIHDRIQGGERSRRPRSEGGTQS